MVDSVGKLSLCGRGRRLRRPEKLQLLYSQNGYSPAKMNVAIFKAKSVCWRGVEDVAPYKVGFFASDKRHSRHGSRLQKVSKWSKNGGCNTLKSHFCSQPILFIIKSSRFFSSLGSSLLPLFLKRQNNSSNPKIRKTKMIIGDKTIPPST